MLLVYIREFDLKLSYISTKIFYTKKYTPINPLKNNLIWNSKKWTEAHRLIAKKNMNFIKSLPYMDHDV